MPESQMDVLIKLSSDGAGLDEQTNKTKESEMINELTYTIPAL